MASDFIKQVQTFNHMLVWYRLDIFELSIFDIVLIRMELCVSIEKFCISSENIQKQYVLCIVFTQYIRLSLIKKPYKANVYISSFCASQLRSRRDTEDRG